MDPNQGKVLASTYRLSRLLGEGGMGKVYEAWHTRLGKKRYAVKLLRPGSADDMEAYARFRREAEIATEIGHPHIVEVHDFNTTDEGQPFIVMEFLEGEDLFEHIKRNNSLSQQEVVRIVSQVARALEAAHGHGIVHRDLKPENIFLSRDPDQQIQVKLLDFGLSKIKHGHSRLTRQNAVFGTPHYMSPEQARGKVDDVDHRTDIFALGVIVYQCLSGTVPFDAPTPLGVLYAVCNDEPTPLSERVPGVSPVVDVVLSRAMAKRRDDRFQSAGEFIEELGEALEATEQVSPVYVRHSSQPARQSLGQRAAATRQQARASGRTKSGPSKTTKPPLPLDATPPPEPAIEPNPRFSDASITKPRPRVSAGEVVVNGNEEEVLPPGAPPVPVAALSADQTPVPSVVIEKGLKPRASGRAASGEIIARAANGSGASIHELTTDNFGVIDPGPKIEPSSNLHEMVTGESLALPPVDADDVIRPSPDQATAETMPAPGGPMTRDRVIAIVVFTVIMVAIGVVVALLTIHA